MNALLTRLCCLIFSALIFGGCATTDTRRVQKALLKPEYSQQQPKKPFEGAQVYYHSGVEGDVPLTYEPVLFFENGRTFERPPTLTSKGWIDILPTADQVELSVSVRNVRESNGEFRPIKSFTGGIEGAVANEIRFLPTQLEKNAPLRIHISDLKIIYNDIRLNDGDLLLFELKDPKTQAMRHFLFRYRALGLHHKFSYAVLVRVPIPGVQSASQIDVGSLSFTVSYSVGYRFRSESLLGKWVSDKVNLVAVAGVGSTTVVDPSLPIDEQFSAAFNAAIVGGGIEVFDFLSLNALVNVSTFSRNRPETTWALAIGFDAVRFTKFTQGLGSRLFKNHQLKTQLPE